MGSATALSPQISICQKVCLSECTLRANCFRKPSLKHKLRWKKIRNEIDLEVLLADLYYQSGEDSKALEIAERILEKTPYNYTAHYILADLTGQNISNERSQLSSANSYRA